MPDDESKKRDGGGGEVGNDFDICGKCEYMHEIARLCACVLFGGTKLVFVAVGILSGGPSEGSRGSGYGHLGCSYRSISPSHIRLSFLCRISRACVSRNSATGCLLLPLRRCCFLFFLPFVFFFLLFYFAHPLTRAADRFQQKCDTNGAIQI